MPDTVNRSSSKHYPLSLPRSENDPCSTGGLPCVVDLRLLIVAPPFHELHTPMLRPRLALILESRTRVYDTEARTTT